MRMDFEIEEEYSQFLSDIKQPEFEFGAYMDESCYEDEYSHNEIDEAKGLLQEKIRTYLHKNRPGEFVVNYSYCIHVMTLERARQSKVSERTIELFLVR